MSTHPANIPKQGKVTLVATPPPPFYANKCESSGISSSIKLFLICGSNSDCHSQSLAHVLCLRILQRKYSVSIVNTELTLPPASEAAVGLLLSYLCLAQISGAPTSLSLASLSILAESNLFLLTCYPLPMM